MKVRIKDIAEKLGISASTVSVVLNNRPSRISEKTKLKILNMAGKMNYNKDIEVDVEDKINIKTIAIIVRDLKNESDVDICINLSNKFDKLGYTLFIIQNNTDILNVLDNILAKGIDGVIFLRPQDSSILKQYFEIFTIPNVIYDNVKISSNFNSVINLSDDIDINLVCDRLVDIILDYDKNSIKSVIIK